MATSQVIRQHRQDFTRWPFKQQLDGISQNIIFDQPLIFAFLVLFDKNVFIVKMSQLWIQFNCSSPYFVVKHIWVSCDLAFKHG